MSKSRILKRADVSENIGLPVVVIDAAREFDEPEGPFIGVPREEELVAAAAMTRCLMSPRLTGMELATLRDRILDLRQPGLSEALGGETTVVTISRWEKEVRDIGDSAEKLIRLLVCERLKAKAPGIAYQPLAIIGLKLTDRKRKLPPMEFRRSRIKAGRSIEEVWVSADATGAKAAA